MKTNMSIQIYTKYILNEEEIKKKILKTKKRK